MTAWTEEQRQAKREQMKAYHAKKKAAKEAQGPAPVIPEFPQGWRGATGYMEADGTIRTSPPTTSETPITPEPILEEVKLPEPLPAIDMEVKVLFNEVKQHLPVTFKDMPSHLVEKLRQMDLNNQP